MIDNTRKHAIVRVYDLHDRANHIITEIVKDFDDNYYMRLALIGLAKIAGEEYTFKKRNNSHKKAGEYIIYVDENGKVDIGFNMGNIINIPYPLLAGVILSGFLENQRISYDMKNLLNNSKSSNALEDINEEKANQEITKIMAFLS